MAYEAVKIEDLGIKPVRRTCSSSAQISKGALLTLSSVNTVANSAATELRPLFGGIAAEDKNSADGRTNISAHLFGVYDCKLTPQGCVMGDLLVISGANLLASLGTITSTMSQGVIVGKAEETGSANDTIRVRLLGY